MKRAELPADTCHLEVTELGVGDCSLHAGIRPIPLPLSPVIHVARCQESHPVTRFQLLTSSPFNEKEGLIGLKAVWSSCLDSCLDGPPLTARTQGKNSGCIYRVPPNSQLGQGPYFLFFLLPFRSCLGCHLVVRDWGVGLCVEDCSCRCPLM